MSDEKNDRQRQLNEGRNKDEERFMTEQLEVGNVIHTYHSDSRHGQFCASHQGPPGDKGAHDVS